MRNLRKATAGIVAGRGERGRNTLLKTRFVGARLSTRDNTLRKTRAAKNSRPAVGRACQER
jgi:hypothetical protein